MCYKTTGISSLNFGGLTESSLIYNHRCVGFWSSCFTSWNISLQPCSFMQNLLHLTLNLLSNYCLLMNESHSYFWKQWQLYRVTNTASQPRTWILQVKQSNLRYYSRLRYFPAKLMPVEQTVTKSRTWTNASSPMALWIKLKMLGFGFWLQKIQ